MNSAKGFIRGIVLTTVFLSILTLAGVSSAAEEYPSREVIIVINYSAGGGLDLVTRCLVEYLGKVVAVPLVVENRPEAAGVKGVLDVYRAKPDGYTLLANLFPGNAITELVYKAPFKIMDLTYLAAYFRSNTLVVVNRDSPYKTLKDLIEASKRKSLNCSTGGVGTLGHLISTVFLKNEVGINLQGIPFKGTAPSVMALLGGNVDMSVLDDLTVTRQIEKIRPLAIISKEPSSKFPGVPTLKELGYDIPVIPAMYGLCGPPGLPEGIQKYLSDVLAKAIKNPEYIRRIDEMGSEPIYLSRPEFHAEYESTYKLVEKNRDAFIEKK